jgi:hypothetical protein
MIRTFPIASLFSQSSMHSFLFCFHFAKFSLITVLYCTVHTSKRKKKRTTINCTVTQQANIIYISTLFVLSFKPNRIIMTSSAVVISSFSSFSSSSSSSSPSSVVRVSSSSRGGYHGHHVHHYGQQEEVHFYTQRLNNSAALCIEVGCYDRAITSLEKALQLLKLSKLQSHHRANNDNDNDDDDDKREKDDEAFLLLSDEGGGDDYCQCHQCSMDGCIIYSETTDLKISDAHYANNSSLSPLNTSADSRTNKKRRVSSMSSSTPTKCIIDQQQLQHNRSSRSSLHGYIYQRPIRVTPRTILEGHIMDYSTMYCIITFNLALANHLSTGCCACCCDNNNVNDNDNNVNNDRVSSSSALVSSTSSIMKMNASLQLYEKLLKTTSSDNTTTNNKNNERFNMIINNNLCHIYRSMIDNDNNNNNNNDVSTSSSMKSSYQSCVHNLLSTIMVVIDRNKIVSNENNTSNDDDYYDYDYDCEYDQEEEEEESSSSSRKRRRHNNTIVDLDGFLQNISPLILQEQCADAA